MKNQEETGKVMVNIWKNQVMLCQAAFLIWVIECVWRQGHGRQFRKGYGIVQHRWGGSILSDPWSVCPLYFVYCILLSNCMATLYDRRACFTYTHTHTYTHICTYYQQYVLLPQCWDHRSDQSPSVQNESGSMWVGSGLYHVDGIRKVEGRSVAWILWLNNKVELTGYSGWIFKTNPWGGDWVFWRGPFWRWVIRTLQTLEQPSPLYKTFIRSRMAVSVLCASSLIPEEAVHQHEATWRCVKRWDWWLGI